MPPIDPSHSRPIDVHRWSDHQEVNALVGEIWEEVFGGQDRPRPGPKPKARPRDMLKVILLDLYVAWTTDPELSIGVNLNLKKWVAGSRYNALHLSRAVPDQIHRLADAGLIELSMGSYSGPGASTNRSARIRAAEPLRARFREARFGRIDIGYAPDRECVILRDADGGELEYEDTAAILGMREELRAYNELLERTYIDLPSFDAPFIERDVTTGPREGQRIRVPFFPGNKFVRRVFSRGDWNLNGRFYGGWWQQIGSELRKTIHINGVPTIERDFRAMHINILSLERGEALGGDPYDLTDGFLGNDIGRQAQRGYLKTLVLTAINASNDRAAYQAFRDSYPRGDPARRFRNSDLERLLAEFVGRTPQLEGALFNDEGIRLMNVDARIAEGVIRGALDLNLPVLCIHDSFIVDYRYAKLLTDFMTESSSHILGHRLPISGEWMGYDEVEEEYLDDYIDARHVQPTRGSRERRAMFEEAVGPIEGV